MLSLDIKYVFLLCWAVYMVQPDTFPKATVYVEVKLYDDVKLGNVGDDVKLVDVEVDANLILAQVNVCE